MLRHSRGQIVRRRKKEKEQQTEFDCVNKRREFKVFLVEDDEAVRGSLKKALEEHNKILTEKEKIEASETQSKQKKKQA